LREKGSELVGRRPETGLLLLRELYVHASEASIDWAIPGQGAREAKDGELLKASKECHPDTLRTLGWTNKKVKASSPLIPMSQMRTDGATSDGGIGCPGSGHPHERGEACKLVRPVRCLRGSPIGAERRY
jgi:hypothetical protein